MSYDKAKSQSKLSLNRWMFWGAVGVLLIFIIGGLVCSLQQFASNLQPLGHN